MEDHFFILVFLGKFTYWIYEFAGVWFCLGKAKRCNTSGAQKTQGFLADKQRALNFYRVFSSAYDILNPYLYTDAMRKEIVSQIEIGADLRVLDVGCGTGYTTSGVLRRRDICEVVGLDMNPVQLNKSR